MSKSARAGRHYCFSAGRSATCTRNVWKISCLGTWNVWARPRHDKEKSPAVMTGEGGSWLIGPAVRGYGLRSADPAVTVPVPAVAAVVPVDRSDRYNRADVDERGHRSHGR